MKFKEYALGIGAEYAAAEKYGYFKNASSVSGLPYVSRVCFKRESTVYWLTVRLVPAGY